jgi:hypothetical protein
MKMLRVTAEEASSAPPESIVCHDVRNPAQRNEVLVRKGSAVSSDEVARLLGLGVGELHLALAQPDDVGEDNAADRLARAVAGDGVTCAAAHFGQVTFSSAVRGLVRVDAERLARVNALEDVLLLTCEPDRPVDAGVTLGVVKCAPLFLPEATLATVERIGSGSVLGVQQFASARVGMVAPGERLRGGAFDRSKEALGSELEWYGSTLGTAVAAEANVESMASAYRQLVDDGSTLIFAAGAAGTDPYDVVFDGLRRAGGEVHQLGIPAEPGTACWIGSLGKTPVLGLASCELFGQPGALDLLLPRLLTGEALDRDLVRRIAVGGLLHGPSRIAPFHTRAASQD